MKPNNLAPLPSSSSGLTVEARQQTARENTDGYVTQNMHAFKWPEFNTGDAASCFCTVTPVSYGTVVITTHQAGKRKLVNSEDFCVCDHYTRIYNTNYEEYQLLHALNVQYVRIVV